METVQALRKHVKSSEDFENAAEFLNILDNAEIHLQNQQGDNDIKVVRCINIEGIDGVGKTTLANVLAHSPHISGHLLSIPSNLKSFRLHFDKQNELVKRNFFHLCDIVVSHELISFPDTTVVILDRYWPTTIAYRLAHQKKLTSSDENICWPSYLVQPSHIVYIYLDEEERHRRIDQRQTTIPINDEEKRIASDSEFRSRLDQIYRQVPGIHPIDGNQRIDKMIDEIFEWIRKSCTKIV